MTRNPTTATTDRPLISILVCTYNRADAIPVTLESIFAQSYAPVEIVVVDDGSTDHTRAVLERYGDRIRYHRLEPNAGIAAARSAACRIARGDYIAFQDDDDLMPPDRLTVLWEALRNNPRAVFAVGDLEIIDSEGNRTGQRWLPRSASDSSGARLVEDGYAAVLWPTLPVVPHTTLFRRADGAAIDWFDERFRHASEDKDFFARLALRGPVVYVPHVVSLVRRGHESLTSHTARTEYGALQLYRKHLDSMSQDADRDRLRRRLAERIAVALERIDSASKADPDGFALPARFADDFAARLPVTIRARLIWRIRVVSPLKRLLRGPHPTARPDAPRHRSPNA